MNQLTVIEDQINLDEESNAQMAFKEKMMDAFTLGIQIECSPDEAELSGAFVEDALIEEDARLSTLDLLHALSDEVVE